MDIFRIQKCKMYEDERITCRKKQSSRIEGHFLIFLNLKVYMQFQKCWGRKNLPYFGEIVEWMGWAVRTWSWVGLLQTSGRAQGTRRPLVVFG